MTWNPCVNLLVLLKVGGSWLSGHAIQDWWYSSSTALSPTPKCLLNFVQVTYWTPALGNETFLSHIQVKHVHGVINGLDLLDLVMKYKDQNKLATFQVDLLDLLCTTQVNSTFHKISLVNSEVMSKVPFTSEQPKRNKMAFCFTSVTNSNVLVN